jgi:uncharacterized protein (TIGR03086 family)
VDTLKVALHRSALDAASQYVDQLGREQLSRPTPCTGWDLATLLAHMIGQHRGFARAVRHGRATLADHAPQEFIPRAWQTSTTELLAAFAGADLSSTVTELTLAPTPLTVGQVVGAQLLDTVVHTWDIAVTIGECYTPAEDLVDIVAAVASAVPDHARGVDTPFGPRRPAYGSRWQRVLADLGRTDCPS